MFDMPLAELLAYRPDRVAPDDFEAFWDALLPGVRVHDVRFSGCGGERVASWLLTPAFAAGPLACVVQYIGYSNGRGRPHEWLLWPAAGYAVFVVDSRGQGGGIAQAVAGLHEGGATFQPPIQLRWLRDLLA
jgi:cephalosporin-C deacetylase